jgi:hypothetical protein
MIQRIQSLLLAGVVILLTINLFVPIWTNTETKPVIVLNAFSISYASLPNPVSKVISIEPLKTKNVYYIAGLITVCIGLTLYIIFQYKNRALQLRLCNLLTVLTLTIIGSYFIAIPAAKSMIAIPSDGNYEAGYFLPILASILILAARYYIRKDEELVKSVDRLR